MNNWQRRLMFYAWLAIAVMLASQLLATWWWVAEIFSHFCFHGAVVVLLASWLMKSRIRYAFMLFSIAIIAWGLLPLSYWHGPAPPTAGQKILLYNVAISNPNPQEEINFIKAANADLLVLIEAGGQWQHHLQKLAYPHACRHAEDSPFAMTVLSRQALKLCQVIQLGGYPYIRIKSHDNRIVYALHPPPPINTHMAWQRKNYLLKTAQHIRNETLPTLAVGDLNNTAFSPLHRSFLQQANLRSQTYHALPTWKPFFLPIDHVMTSKDGKQTAYVTPLDWQYSDHRPLLIYW